MLFNNTSFRLISGVDLACTWTPFPIWVHFTVFLSEYSSALPPFFNAAEKAPKFEKSMSTSSVYALMSLCKLSYIYIKLKFSIVNNRIEMNK